MKKNIIKYWRYLLVILILLFMYLFMGNFTPNASDLQLKSIQEQLFNSENQIYILPFGQNSIKTVPILSSRMGDYYRLTFQLGVSSDYLKDANKYDSSIELLLEGENGGTQSIGIINVAQSSDFIYKEQTFITNGDYQKLLIRRMDKNDTLSYTIKEVDVNRLDCVDAACFSSVKATTLGAYDLGVVAASERNDEKLFTFYRSKQNFGQVFKATQDNINEVSFSLKKIGTGGIGNYQIVVRSANINNNGFDVQSGNLVSYYFNALDLKKYLIEKDTYKFPIGNYTEKGKYYYIGIDNSSVKQNVFNTIQMLGSSNPNIYTEGEAKLLGSNKTYGDLYFRIHAVENTIYKSKNLLLNSRIEDLGNNNLVYRYKYSNTVNDYLDILNNDQQDKSQVFYDSLAKSISASASGDTSVVYKFDTIWPFYDAYFSYKKVSADFVDTVVFYSFVWNTRNKNEKDDSYGNSEFSEQLLNTTNSSQLYLKFSYSNEDVGKKTLLFGIKDLTVIAKMKNN